ncbi:MAG: hypothetical protein EP338_12585 [Bacteroidetes bacterium]|nr:MAG: hypothetical protein EP338_12585 [Bacteroidota bacterium]
MHIKFVWLIVCLVSVGVLSGCRKGNANPQVELIGHAGNGLNRSNSLYHANSYEAIKHALELDGASGVEVDVQLGADGSLWLYHDPQLDSETDSEGCISEKTGEELSGITYKGIQGENLCSLKRLAVWEGPQKTLFLDLRHLNACENQYVSSVKMRQEIEELLDGGGTYRVILITSNEAWVPELKKGPFEVYFSSPTVNFAKELLLSYPQLDGLVLKNKAVEKEDVDWFREQKKKVAIFEVRSPKGIRKALRKGADFLISDDLRAAVIAKDNE